MYVATIDWSAYTKMVCHNLKDCIKQYMRRSLHNYGLMVYIPQSRIKQHMYRSLHNYGLMVYHNLKDCIKQHMHRSLHNYGLLTHVCQGRRKVAAKSAHVQKSYRCRKAWLRKTLLAQQVALQSGSNSQTIPDHFISARSYACVYTGSALESESGEEGYRSEIALQ